MSIAEKNAGTSGMDLSIVIVSFNDGDVLLPCLRSIYEWAPEISFEVILVDNGSRDGSVGEVRRLFGEVVVVEAGYNSGYAGGNNIGFEKAGGRWVLFLNPDTLVMDGSLEALVSRADSLPGCGAIGPRVLNRDSSLQRTLSRAPRVWDFLAEALMLHRIPGYIRLFGDSGYREGDYDREIEVDTVSGCCLVARRNILDEIGAFDEEYFIYFEETDLCERIRRSGHKVIYTPAASIVHLGHATTVKRKTWFKIQHERSRRRFFRKNRSRVSLAAIGVILLVKSLLRVVLGTLGIVLTAGCRENVRSSTATALRMLGWQLGLVKHGPRPS
ncbi:MAG: glycosyltransferase family 2 protein [Planctomycetes bacterium]|nr:glycosyltransferase family 2 protein [Planctomycetota bacterium]